MLIRLTFIEGCKVKTRLEQQLAVALAALKSNGFLLPNQASVVINVTRSRHASQGDYSSNLAMLLAKSTGRKPQEIGQALIAALPLNDVVRRVDIAEPGFINFFLTRDVQTAVVGHVLEQGSQFGRSEQGVGRRLLVEVVSENTIGPLHIGHGREVVLGDTVANLLRALGFEVECVIRVVNADRQLDRLAENNEELGKLGIRFDRDNCERGQTDDVGSVIDKLESVGRIYTKGGVRWFRSTAFGDDKDQAMMMANGTSTSLALDIARIESQFARGFHKVVSVCGVDRQGPANSLRAAAAALGLPAGALVFLMVQPVALRRADQRLSLPTRTHAVSLSELYDETGKDAARFFYLMRSHRQPLDIDLVLTASQSSENPLYCVQYAYARICSVERQFHQQGLDFNLIAASRALVCFTGSSESEILTLLTTYPEIVERAAYAQEPHQLIWYLRDLANALHSYYNTHKILVEDAELRSARFCLLLAVRQVLVNGLTLIDVSTPEVM